MSRNITAVLKVDPLYSGPDKVLNGQTLVATCEIGSAFRLHGTCGKVRNLT